MKNRKMVDAWVFTTGDGDHVPVLGSNDENDIRLAREDILKQGWCCGEIVKISVPAPEAKP